jgi:hypothetical protein
VAGFTLSLQAWTLRGMRAAGLGVLRVTSIDVVVADDHPFILRGVSDFLKSASNIRVIDTCSDGARARWRRSVKKNQAWPSSAPPCRR